MVTGLPRRLIYGVGANFVGHAAIILVQVFGIPLLLHSWGAKLYGEWLFLFAIPSYLSMSDLGFSQSAANDMTRLVARGDFQAAQRIFQSLIALLAVCCGVGVLLVAGLVLGLPFDRMWHSPDLTASNARTVVFCLSLGVIIGLAEGVNLAGFRSNQDYALYSLLFPIRYFALNVGIWMAALLGWGLVGAAETYLVIRCVVTPATAILLRFKHPWLRFGFQNASLPELRRLTRPALANLGQPLASAVSLQGMILAIGVILGPVAVVAFSTLRTMSRLIYQFVMSIYFASEPELAAAYGLDNHQLFRDLFINAMRASLWLATLGCLCLYFLGGPLLRLWTHGKVPMEAFLFGWLLLASFVGIVGQGALVVVRSHNRHLRISLVYCAGAVLAVLSALLLMRSTGRLEYAGMCMFLSDAVVAGYALFIASSMAELKVSAVISYVIDPLPALRMLIRKLRVI